MKMNKVLAAGIMAAVVLAPAGSANVCNNGGFYVGANLGASFNKASVKFDKDGISEKVSKLKDALIAKLEALSKAADEKWDEGKMKEHAKSIADSIGTILADCTMQDLQILTLVTSFKAVGTTIAAGSLGAIAKSDSSSRLAKLVKLLYASDPTMESKDIFKNVLSLRSVAGNIAELMSPAVFNLAKNGKLSDLADILLKKDAAGAFDLTLAPAPAVASVAADVNAAVAAGASAVVVFMGAVGRPIVLLDSLDTFYENNGTAGAYGLAKASNEAYVAELKKVDTLVETYRGAVSDRFESNENLKAVFYAKGADGKLTNTLVDTIKVKENMKTYSDNLVTKGISDLGLSDSKNTVSKKATGFLFEALFGFDHRINDVMIGIDLNVGMETGGKAKIKDKKVAKGIEVQRQLAVALMPRVGYLVAPQFEVFFTGGVSVGRYKVNTSKMLEVFDFSNLKKMGEAYNKNKTDEKDKINLATWGDKDVGKVFKSHKKTKLVPVLGVGVSYEITPEVFARLAYNYAFKTKLVSTAAAGAEVKYASHVIKAGLGFRF